MKEADLPEPEYKEELGGFSVYFYKDIYTEQNLRNMRLNERQIKAVMYTKEKGRIMNKEYRELCEVKKRQTIGKGTYYVLREHQTGEKTQ